MNPPKVQDETIPDSQRMSRITKIVSTWQGSFYPLNHNSTWQGSVRLMTLLWKDYYLAEGCQDSGKGHENNV